jgi:nucleoside-diphosphate-sugar epimerase
MRALVTGATGFIGSHLVEELLKRGYLVTCLLRKASSLKWIEGLDVSIKYGDCLDGESLLEAVRDVDFVFHLAGLTKAARKEDFFSVNAGGTENLLKALLANNPGVRRFLHLSSLAAVGPSANGRPVDEETSPRPVSSYGKSKLQAEAVVARYKGAIATTVIRPPAVYGPRDRDMLVFCSMLKRGIFPYWGRCYYSLLYVDDLVKGIIASAESEDAKGETFFLSEDDYSNEQIAEIVSEAVGRKPVRLRIPRLMMPVIAGIGCRLFRGQAGIINADKAKELAHNRWTCSSSKAGARLGFSPKIKINEGIRWTTNWYRIHQWL